MNLRPAAVQTEGGEGGLEERGSTRRVLPLCAGCSVFSACATAGGGCFCYARAVLERFIRGPRFLPRILPGEWAIALRGELMSF